MHKYYKIILYLTLALFLVTITLNNWSHVSFVSNEFLHVNKRNDKCQVPNIIHYILFGKRTIDFYTYLSILSSIKIQKPSVLYIHTDSSSLAGDNWAKLLTVNDTRPVITLNYLPEPTHVYGQPISSIYHATDVARITVLQKWGGVYLDSDVLVLKCLDSFRNVHEMVVGWPENEYIGTQILLACKRARFLAAWLHGYRRYTPRNWYYNAGQYPTEQVLAKMPHLAYRVPELFGVHNWLHELYETSNWTDWKRYYAIHLLSRHSPAPLYVNESLLEQMNNTFAQIATYVLDS